MQRMLQLRSGTLGLTVVSLIRTTAVMGDPLGSAL